ncbi:DUF1120 domain-containing protein [Burkholderia cenocepacia]|uniref:DUF1120 domain-containing protein n=1 Tax=Burkholderia cenocepacia TaxID=95486 RepID=UPI002AB67E9F|nr:DUF1120 domain-containing protein [Burkholderia cenocepacia]
MILKKLRVLSALACALSIPGVTVAADLSVGGQIQAGGACSITLGNGGVFDLGAMSRKNDFPSPYHARYGNSMLTLNCQHPTRVGIDVVDNRKGTASKDNSWNFGLGDPAIGYYTIAIYDAQVDGRDGFQIWRGKGSPYWGDRHDNRWSSRSFSSDATISWDVGGPQVEPVAFKTLTADFFISFRPKYDSTFTDELELNGSATLELVYL